MKSVGNMHAGINFLNDIEQISILTDVVLTNNPYPYSFSFDINYSKSTEI